MNRTGRRSMSACATRLRSSSFPMGWCSRQRLLCPRRLRTRSSTRAVILDGATPDSVTKTETAFSSPPEVERKHARAFQASVLSSSRPDTAAEAGGPVPSSSEDARFQPTGSLCDGREGRAPLWGRPGGRGSRVLAQRGPLTPLRTSFVRGRFEPWHASYRQSCHDIHVSAHSSILQDPDGVIEAVHISPHACNDPRTYSTRI